MREGYEGLVRGNIDAPKRKVVFGDQTPVEDLADDKLVNNLRFGDGGLLREGEGDAVDHPGGRSLKGRYIIRVGWDDVRGWFAQVCSPTLLGYFEHANNVIPREGHSSERLGQLRSVRTKAG